MSKNTQAFCDELGFNPLVLAGAFLALGIFLTFGNPALARIEIEGVNVYSEKESESDIACGMYQAAVTAAVESTLRANRIPVLSDEEKTGHISAYANFTALDLDAHCSVSYRLVFELYGGVPYRQSGKEVYGNLNLCSKGGIINASKADVSETVLTSIRSFTEQCISETERADE